MYFFDDGIVTQLYGEADGSNGYDFHTGLDMFLDSGLISSLTDGTIFKTGYDAGSWGNYVVVQNDSDQNYVIYAHMETPTSYYAGQTVSTGEIIGVQGSTGNSTGEHLHLEVRTDYYSSSTSIDPLEYFTSGFDYTSGVDEYTSEERSQIWASLGEDTQTMVKNITNSVSEGLESLGVSLASGALKLFIVIFAVALIYAALTKGLLGGK